MSASLLRAIEPQKVLNNAGGLSYTVNQWDRLNRFLILGTEGGTYYVDEHYHTLDNIVSLEGCIRDDFVHTVDLIVKISTSGRAPKNDYAIFALAKVASCGNKKAERYALARLNEVCRTGTHLFQFVAFIDKMRGWGPALRKAVADWYLTKSPDDLAFQVLKYGQREGWSHRDILRKTHPKAHNRRIDQVLSYVVNGTVSDTEYIPRLITVDRLLKHTSDMYPAWVAVAVQEDRIPREMIPTQFLNDIMVQRALMETSPYTALMRNLGNFTKTGALNNDTADFVADRLTNEKYIEKSRVHPINVLTALRTYTSGRGFRGNSSWTPVPAISKALEDAFYAAFKNANPTGQRYLVGIDVSGSMSSPVYDGILTSAEIAAALAMTLVRSERYVYPMAFSHEFKSLPITPHHRLEDVLSITRDRNFGATDCALPMTFALQNKIPIDVFVVITDNETWYGQDPWGRQRGTSLTPADALRKYRQEMGIDARLIVLATSSTRFSIADPNDKGMLDIAGFDSAVPAIINEFSIGNI